MKQLLNNKTIVVGAGGGGIASALLAAHRGEIVTLIESHSALGGCASWFRRGQYIFDAGATTLSGVGVNEPLGQLFKSLGHFPQLMASDPGIVFHLSSGKVIRYHRDFEKWMEELSVHFPSLKHRPFWELTTKINKKSWSLLRDVKTFPFKSPKDILEIVKFPQHAFLLPYLLISTELALKHFGLDHPEYLELVNGILLISAQANSEHIPFLVGAMALSYPAETYAPVGGMKGLMDFFENELVRTGVDIKKSTKVESFKGNEVTLEDSEKLFADKLIINLPVWNMAEMTEGSLKDKLAKESQSHPGSWGALTVYFGARSEVHDFYHQIHLNHPKIKNYFVSFSIPGDHSRAPQGHQAVSISTHVYAEDNVDKNELSQIIMKDFIKRFPVSEVKFLTTGSPRSFERYTGRKSGFVGGLPFLFGKNPLSLIGPLTATKGVFRVGDTVFPGQGLCGVVAGALQLHHRLVRE